MSSICSKWNTNFSSSNNAVSYGLSSAMESSCRCCARLLRFFFLTDSTLPTLPLIQLRWYGYTAVIINVMIIILPLYNSGCNWSCNTVMFPLLFLLSFPRRIFAPHPHPFTSQSSSPMWEMRSNSWSTNLINTFISLALLLPSSSGALSCRIGSQWVRM